MNINNFKQITEIFISSIRTLLKNIDGYNKVREEIEEFENNPNDTKQEKLKNHLQ